MLVCVSSNKTFFILFVCLTTLRRPKVNRSREYFIVPTTQRRHPKYCIKGYLSQDTCETNIFLWTGFDDFRDKVSQVLRGNIIFLSFKNPPIFGTQMFSIHLHRMRCPIYVHKELSLNTVIHMGSKTKSHTDVAPCKVSCYLPDNMCFICFSKLPSMGPCAMVILLLQINRIVILTFKIQLLLGINMIS